MCVCVADIIIAGTAHIWASRSWAPSMKPNADTNTPMTRSMNKLSNRSFIFEYHHHNGLFIAGLFLTVCLPHLKYSNVMELIILSELWCGVRLLGICVMHEWNSRGSDDWSTICHQFFPGLWKQILIIYQFILIRFLLTVRAYTSARTRSIKTK